MNHVETDCRCPGCVTGMRNNIACDVVSGHITEEEAAEQHALLDVFEATR
jgi:hypothetical protein